MNKLWLLSLFTMPVAAIPLADKLAKEIGKEFPKGSRVTVERVRTNVPFNGNAEITSLSPSPALGLITFQASPVDGSHSVSGTAFVRVWSKIAVATRPIQHKESFTPKNVAFEERELSQLLGRSFFFTPTAVLEKRAKGFIRAGQPLGINNTDTAMQIESGKLVDMVKSNGMITVSARVRAIDSGRPGDMIRVENPASRKIMTAKVVTSESVEVN